MTRLRLLTVGPVDVEDEILEALGRPTLPHYGPLWLPTYNATLELLNRLFQTRNDMLLMPGPGSGALDAAIGSLFPPESSICVPSNGFFGERVQQIVEGYGLAALVVEFPVGAPVDPALLRKRLKELIPQAHAEGRPMRALAVVHHETSTGVLNPLAEIAQVAHEFDLLLVVDAVASLGGVALPVDEWGLDICVTVPNKCLGAPPGVAMMSVSPRCWALAQANPRHHGWYLDLRTWAWFRENWAGFHPFPTTLPTNVIVALNEALTRIFEMGFDRHLAKIRTAALDVREGLDELGFKMFPDPDYAAPVVSAYHALPNRNVNEMMHYLHDEYGLMLSGGLADLAGKIFRISHMGGASDPEVVKTLLEGVKTYLKMGAAG